MHQLSGLLLSNGRAVSDSGVLTSWPIRSRKRSQPRCLLSTARSNSAKSRTLPSCCRLRRNGPDLLGFERRLGSKEGARVPVDHGASGQRRSFGCQGFIAFSSTAEERQEIRHQILLSRASSCCRERPETRPLLGSWSTRPDVRDEALERDALGLNRTIPGSDVSDLDG